MCCLLSYLGSVRFPGGLGLWRLTRRVALGPCFAGSSCCWFVASAGCCLPTDDAYRMVSLGPALLLLMGLRVLPRLAVVVMLGMQLIDGRVGVVTGLGSWERCRRCGLRMRMELGCKFNCFVRGI